MVFAGVVIRTAPGAAPRVAARLLSEPGLELQGGDGDHRIAAVFTGRDGAALEALAARLGRDPDVAGVAWTHVGDGPDAEAPASATRRLREEEP